MGTKRRGEMWISNNRVLVGGNKKVTGRNPNFDTEETRVLISLWGDPKVQKTLITTHKKHAVIAKLAEKMRDYGYFRSPEEINTRIKNLKCFYNRIKKEMEFGVTAEPTWKHYSAMDEIMTRPIFSVRPNEIPKPSLRYRLEEEMKEREEKEREKEKEKKKQIIESDNTDDDDDDDEDDDDDDDEEDIDEVSLTQEMLEDELKANHQEEEGKVKQEQDSSNDVEETPLIIPKEEPIDVDDEPINIKRNRGNSESSDAFPKLSAYLQLTSSSSISSENKTITTIAGNNHNATNSSDILTSSSSTPNIIKISQSMVNGTPTYTTVFTNQQHPVISSQAGKISLVPTNLLLKPQQQQIQLRGPHLTAPQPHRLIYPKPTTVQTAAGATSASIATTTNAAGQQMKVLLLNTLQKPTASNTVSAAVLDSQIKTNVNTSASAATAASAINAALQQQQQKQQQQQQQTNITRVVNNSNTTCTVPEKRQKLSSSKQSKDGTSFRSLLSHLVRVQTENLEVNKQRLEVEKQRLDFEKTIAEKILNAFLAQSSISKQPLSSSSSATTTLTTTTTTQPSEPQSQAQPQIQTPQISPSPSTTPLLMNGATITLLTPKIEKENDGYEN